MRCRTSSEPSSCELLGQCTDTPSDHWGQYSPFFSPPSTIDPSIPPSCNLTFALVLSRHGSRFPTARMAKDFKKLLKRIRGSVQDYGRGYEFLKHQTLDLGAEELTAYGQMEMLHSGTAFYERYEGLARHSDPFVRASGSGRVIMSAHNFSQGFYRRRHGSLSHNAANAHPKSPVLVLPEGRGYNNTLDHGICQAFEEGPWSTLGRDKQSSWSRIWAAPIRERLNSKLPGANLTTKEATLMMDLCPFVTVATAKLDLADFCRLFTREEWLDYDYSKSLQKWYGYGNGNPLGPTQGVGYVNELLARLTGQPVQDHTTTNSTLDSSPETFPLDRKLYADFSHDNTMASIYAALRLYDETGELPEKQRVAASKANGYSASWTVPFAGRMYVEKMRCRGVEEEEMVRVLVNGRVMDLTSCGGDELGRCRLSRFVESLAFARAGGRWDECFR